MNYKIERDELKGWLYLAAPGADGGKLMTLGNKGRTMRGSLVDTLESVITSRSIDIVSLDPFIKTHAVEENAALTLTVP